MFLLMIGMVFSIVVGVGLFLLTKNRVAGIGATAVISFVVFIGSMFTVISAGHVGVQVTLGEVNPVPLVEGVHLVNPISSVREVDARLQKAQLKNANASTRDMQEVHTDIVVNYRLSGERAPRIFKEFGLDVDQKVLEPAINETFKAVTARYSSEELITKRDEVSQHIKDHLRSKLIPFDMSVNEISLVNFGFSTNYQKAIESKVIATQTKLKAEQDLERIKIEAQQSIAKAKGEAEAIAIQTQAINSQGGSNYIELKRIEKWDGKYPTTMVGGNTGLMLNTGK